MLYIQQLSKSFATNHVLQKLDLLIEKNSLTGIIGPNGCGKSTLFNILTGEISADSGSITLNDESILGLRPRHIAKRGILRKFQIPGIYPDMLVSEHLHLPFVIKKNKINNSLMQKTAQRMGLRDVMSVKAGLLSTGQKQWLELAMLVLLTPTLLLLDEPIAGMTDEEAKLTLNILHELNADGLTIITIEHNIDFVKSLTDDIVVIMDGKVIQRSAYEEIVANEYIRSHYLGSLYS